MAGSYTWNILIHHIYILYITSTDITNVRKPKYNKLKKRYQISQNCRVDRISFKSLGYKTKHHTLSEHAYKSILLGTNVALDQYAHAG